MSLAVPELLLQRVIELGLDIKTDSETTIETLLERELTVPELDDAAC